LSEMWENRLPVDIITVQQRLKDKGMLEQVGGIAYLSQLQDAVPSAANLTYYLDILVEKSVLRELYKSASGIAGKAFDFAGNVDELVSESEKEILAIRQKRETGRGETDINAIINEMADNFERAAAGQKPAGLETGFPDLDKIMGTMKPQELIIIAGTPSAGKTTLLYNIFWNLAREKKITGLINLDTSAYSATYRYSCLAGQVDGWKCERGIADEDDRNKMATGAGLVSQHRRYLKIRDDVNTESRLVAACRRMKQDGCEAIGIDFMQQLTCQGKSKYEKISRSAEVVKGLAKELNIPVIAISSLNRENAKEQKKPTMQDLNGSGDIEYHANKIILLHCENREQSIREVELNVAKNKDGMCGRLNLTMFAPQFRFESAAKILEETY
jgi:replicative DNA helicase